MLHFKLKNLCSIILVNFITYHFNFNDKSPYCSNGSYNAFQTLSLIFFLTYISTYSIIY